MLFVNFRSKCMATAELPAEHMANVLLASVTVGRKFMLFVNFRSKCMANVKLRPPA
jgi:hypothetical protein